MTYSNTLFFHREWAARGLVVVGLTILLVSPRVFQLEPKVVPAAIIQPMRITIAEQVTPVVPDVKPDPIPPKPIPKPTPKPKPIPKAPPAPAPALEPVPQPVQEPVPQPVQEPVAIPPAAVSNPNDEAAYAQQVRSQIERHKIYPDLARRLDMSGDVEISYVINRQGKLISVKVTTTSGSAVLDKAAVQAVRTAIFPVMPSDAWREKMLMKFKTKLVYSLEDE